MRYEDGLDDAAALFKVLGAPSRLAIVRLLTAKSTTVSELVERTGMSQPLVSQHLRNLRQVGILEVSRNGREAVYRIADHHVAHIVDDAVAHVLETPPGTRHHDALPPSEIA